MVIVTRWTSKPYVPPPHTNTLPPLSAGKDTSVPSSPAPALRRDTPELAPKAPSSVSCSCGWHRVKGGILGALVVAHTGTRNQDNPWAGGGRSQQKEAWGGVEASC